MRTPKKAKGWTVDSVEFLDALADALKTASEDAAGEDAANYAAGAAKATRRFARYLRAPQPRTFAMGELTGRILGDIEARGSAALLALVEQIEAIPARDRRVRMVAQDWLTDWAAFLREQDR